MKANLFVIAGCEFEVDPKFPFDSIITPRVTVKRSDFPENTKKSKGSRLMM